MIDFSVKFSAAVTLLCSWTLVFAEFGRRTEESTGLELRLQKNGCPQCKPMLCDDYEDPAAMFGRDHYMNAQQKTWSTPNTICKCHCDSNALPAKYNHYVNVLQRLVSEMLTKANPDSETNNIFLKLEFSREDFREMQAFRYSEANDGLGRLMKILPVLSKIATDATAHEEHFKGYFHNLMSGLSILNDYREMMVVILLAILTYALIHWWFILSKSWYLVLWKGFILLFLLSSFWKWVLLYKKAVAKNFSRQSKYFVEHGQEIPRECRPREMSWWMSFTTWLSSKFSVMPSDCEEYFETVIVDPVWSVSPLDAVSETFWNLVFYPLKVLATYIGLFFLNLFQVLPVYLWTPVAASMIFFFALFLVMQNGYHVRILYCLLELIPTQRPALMPHERERIETITSYQRPQITHVECAKCKELVRIQESDANFLTHEARSTLLENGTERFQTQVPPQPGPSGDCMEQK